MAANQARVGLDERGLAMNFSFLPVAALSLPVFLGATMCGAAPAKPAARFEGKDTLLRPEGYREWVFVGNSLGLRYEEGKKEPGLRGSFQKEFTGLSAAVKDKERFPDGWAYFSFSDGPGKTKEKAPPAKKSACYDCHREKGAEDNVFTQFYPVLKAARARADESSWEGKAVLLTRPGVKLEAPDGEKIAPRTAGVARDLLFAVRKDEGGRLRVESRRQAGWVAKDDAVPIAEAVPYFTKRLAKDPKDVHALTGRGQAYAARNEPDKALADFDEAVRLDTKATLARYHRANLHYGRGQYQKAMEEYDVVIRQDPKLDWAYHVRGWIYYRKQDYAKALADFEAAI